MAIPQIDINHQSVAVEIQTINQIANLEGDLVTLTTTDKTTLVNAINEVQSNVGVSKRTVLTYAIAMG